ncbi:hypothetical protein MY10362_004825 [Beauveria mimosiformis]
MAWTIISIRAPSCVVDDPHNSIFRRSDDLEYHEDAFAAKSPIEQSDHGTPAPTSLPPDVTLALTTEHFPKDPSVGFVFGTDRAKCDILLPSLSTLGISKRHFAITFQTTTGAVLLRNLSKKSTKIVANDENERTGLQSQRVFPKEGITKHILTFHVFNFNDGEPELIMEYAVCGSLANLIRTNSFTVREACTTIKHTFLALQYLHGMGVTHRDIKPGNILIMTRYPIHAKVADFGLSSKADHLVTFCGTERYLAPEIHRPPYTAKVDIWSRQEPLAPEYGIPPEAFAASKGEDCVTAVRLDSSIPDPAACNMQERPLDLPAQREEHPSAASKLVWNGEVLEPFPPHGQGWLSGYNPQLEGWGGGENFAPIEDIPNWNPINVEEWIPGGANNYQLNAEAIGPGAKDNEMFVVKGTTYHFFDWRETKIAHIPDQAMVNVTHMVATAGLRFGQLRRPRFLEMIRDKKRVIQGHNRISGTYMPYSNAIEICLHLDIDSSGLPSFLS